ncbi:MAG: hypothetical protein IKW96_02750 [Ruminococcus sp.]|uniref:hypothetical protein n=1 Tax=Ruminococcus sp. TaxID=41978 RepID=UPI0025CDFD03|nr:hypothetical protein [Ruminococcus sp.]MBR5682192.1 hypothetical protein [Ruminococcus sp.]
MDKFVSYDKMSKKEKKKIDSTKRGSWNGVDPATKVVDTDKRRYRRKPKHPESFDE